MIAYVKGTVDDIAEDNVVIDVGGIGYNVKISAGTMHQLPRLHQEVTLHTYMAVREDACWLYGFVTRDELELFKLLITVNGVGPKGALGILSVMTPRDLRFAILAADGKMISRAPGIGKKTAERVILDLRDKISADDADDTAQSAPAADIGSADSEAVEALIALGYGAAEALKAVSQVAGREQDTEAILKAALKKMV